ncbi:MAG TPA: glycosyltransferase [Vineibacter sp.]|nr:glycosyltransferase [Vineibacter sp.]
MQARALPDAADQRRVGFDKLSTIVDGGDRQRACVAWSGIWRLEVFRTTMATRVVQLQPAVDVERVGSTLQARSAAAWLRLHFPDGVPSGRWIKLTYRGSYFDPLVRPVLRFVTDQDHEDVLAPAPLFGRTHWIGRVPDGSREVLVSPVDRPGPFGFEIDACRTLTWTNVIAAAWPNDSRRTLEAIGAFSIGRRQDARRWLRQAVGSAPIKRFEDWRAARWRDMEPAGLEAPRNNWSLGPRIHIVAMATADDGRSVGKLRDQLVRQPYPNWSLTVVSPTGHALMQGLAAAASNPPVQILEPDAAAAMLLAPPEADGLLTVFDASDGLPAYALAVIAESALTHPDAVAFYGDEDSVDAAGRHSEPRLKPDWSPTFNACGHYVRSALFVRRRVAAPLAAMRIGDLVCGESLNGLLAGRPAAEVMHIRRVLLSKPAARRDPAAPAVVRTPTAEVSARSAARPHVTVIIPNRDQFRLISQCLTGLARTTDFGDIEVLIADNGSSDAAVLRLYESHTASGRLRVIHCPGPFNFALQCNLAAEQAQAAFLVFLNNDIEMFDGDWLPRLLAWARQADVGAVGARLLYPSGRLQHVGHVLGLGGTTGHVDRNASADDHGYLNRNDVPHEVSAVTAACLAVEKRKFAAVGGFDAMDLPVELNDVDLCLRLAACGWRTLLEPRSVLIHHESASRGTWKKRPASYTRQHAIFRQRWHALIRDDPNFHPALSLHSLRTALG